MIYKEASSESAQTAVLKQDGNEASLTVPETSKPGDQIHVIVKAQADGAHRLVHYQQVVICVK